MSQVLVTLSDLISGQQQEEVAAPKPGRIEIYDYISGASDLSQSLDLSKELKDTANDFFSKNWRPED